MADYFLRKWTPTGGPNRDVSPDIFVWDQVIKTISSNSQGRDAIGLLLGSVNPTIGNGPYVVMIEDIVPARRLSTANVEFSQAVLTELLEDWRNNYHDKLVVGWFRIISHFSRQIRLPANDAAVHQSFFTQPYQVALAFSQQSTDAYVGFSKSEQGRLNVERTFPFIELSDSPGTTGLPIQNMVAAETSRQDYSSDRNRRQSSQPVSFPAQLIHQFGLHILIFLAVLTPFLINFGVINTGSTPENPETILELPIPPHDSQDKFRFDLTKLDGSPEGINSISIQYPPQTSDQTTNMVWVERLQDNPLDVDPPGGFITYAYYSIASKDADEETEITFEFGVPERWKALRGVGEDTIRAYKSSDDRWTEIKNSGSVKPSQGEYVFEAASRGFSFYAIGGTRANQPVSVTVEISTDDLRNVERVIPGNQPCSPRYIVANEVFTCDLGTELSLGLTTPYGSISRFKGWLVDGKEYAVDAVFRLTSDTKISARFAPPIIATPTPTPDPTQMPTPTPVPDPTQVATPDPTPPADPTQVVTPDSAPTATPGTPVDPTLAPPPAVSTKQPAADLVKVSYIEVPMGSGTMTAYQDIQDQVACDKDDDPPVEYKGYLCPANSEITLLAKPNSNHDFVDFIIDADGPNPKTYKDYLSKFQLLGTDIKVTANFKIKPAN